MGQIGDALFQFEFALDQTSSLIECVDRLVMDYSLPDRVEEVLSESYTKIEEGRILLNPPLAVQLVAREQHTLEQARYDEIKRQSGEKRIVFVTLPEAYALLKDPEARKVFRVVQVNERLDWITETRMQQLIKCKYKGALLDVSAGNEFYF